MDNVISEFDEQYQKMVRILRKDEITVSNARIHLTASIIAK